LHSFLVVDRFDAGDENGVRVELLSGSLHSIGQIYRILVGVVCKFCVVSQGRRLGCCVGENGSRSLCAGPDALSLPEVMARAAVARRAFGVARERGPVRLPVVRQSPHRTSKEASFHRARAKSPIMSLGLLHLK
jgi:hypothetical protein